LTTFSAWALTLTARTDGERRRQRALGFTLEHDLEHARAADGDCAWNRVLRRYYGRVREAAEAGQANPHVLSYDVVAMMATAAE